MSSDLIIMVLLFGTLLALYLVQPVCITYNTCACPGYVPRGQLLVSLILMVILK